MFNVPLIASGTASNFTFKKFCRGINIGKIKLAAPSITKKTPSLARICTGLIVLLTLGISGQNACVAGILIRPHALVRRIWDALVFGAFTHISSQGLRQDKLSNQLGTLQTNLSAVYSQIYSTYVLGAAIRQSSSYLLKLLCPLLRCNVQEGIEVIPKIPR